MSSGDFQDPSLPPEAARKSARALAAGARAAGGGEFGEAEAQALRRSRARPFVPKRTLFRRVLWSIVQKTAFQASFHTSNRWRCWLLRLFGARIGPGCTIRRSARVYYPWLLEMGSVSCLGDDATVYNLGKVTIGDRVVVSQEAYLCAGSHDYTRLDMPLITPPIVLGDDCWICARAFVCPGVTVGGGAIVGAASVVTKDVPNWTIVGGNPARPIKSRSRPR